MPELSIIVPVYKVEKYLPKCIDSILAQTFTDFELILIDDGSPDRCGEICDEYAKRDGRILVIHQENQGVSAARNAGLDVAQGKYIGFVDSDDWIDREYYEKMTQHAQTAKAEIVTGAFSVCDQNGIPIRDILTSEGVYQTDQMIQELFSTPDQLGGTCCNKIFLRSVIKDIRFPVEMTMCEDRFYLFQCYILCKRNVKFNIPLYYVVENPNSATRVRSVDIPFAIIESSRSMMLFARGHIPRIEALATNRYLDDCLRHLSIIKTIAADSGEAYRMRRFVVRLRFIFCLVRCMARGILPRNKIHGFLFGLIKG